ncbi:MAG: repressor LexA [Candidatus Goldbacteria bacterium]|nr:repressor LexA [Candidatus Goldiibacteriota bacterium]
MYRGKTSGVNSRSDTQAFYFVLDILLYKLYNISMKTTLTDSEIEALRQIRNSIMQYGRPPSVRELMKRLGYNSPRSVSYLFEKLEKKKIITRTGRDIKIITYFEGDDSRVNTVDVPIVGEVACGMPILAEQNILDKIPVSLKIAKPPYKYFLLKAKGDSMNKKGINNGDLVLIRQQQTAKSGDIVVALIDDEATIKEYKDLDGAIALMPRSTNPKHKPIIIQDDFMIQGVVQKVLTGLGA